VLELVDNWLKCHLPRKLKFGYTPTLFAYIAYWQVVV
jgi:hypothetical protein